MGKNEYDIVIVGAGCAGPAAAKKAAELGLKVLLLEKSQKPGEKNVSGTCLNIGLKSSKNKEGTMNISLRCYEKS